MESELPRFKRRKLSQDARQEAPGIRDSAEEENMNGNHMSVDGPHQDGNVIIPEKAAIGDVAKTSDITSDQPPTSLQPKPVPADLAAACSSDAAPQIPTEETTAKDDADGAEDQAPIPEATAPLVATLPTDFNPPALSKTAQKKARKQAEWEAKRDERKAIRKEKQTAKRERKKAARDSERETGPHRPVHAPRAAQLPITILVDCDFDDLMRDIERKSLASQITRCYSDNRTAPFRAHLAVCSFGGQLRQRFDNVLDHYKGWKGVRFVENDFVAAAAEAREWMREPRVGGALVGPFAPEETSQDAGAESGPEAEAVQQQQQARLEAEAEVVYLSSEAEETLTTLKPYSTYIIGGLVDKNREKGLCHRRACERGVRTARLPISEFMDLQSRKVLATNHVNEIMLRWLELRDWGEAFMRVIPKRKGGKLKSADTDQGLANAPDGVEDEDDENADDQDGGIPDADNGSAMVAGEGDNMADDNDEGQKQGT